VRWLIQNRLDLNHTHTHRPEGGGRNEGTEEEHCGASQAAERAAVYTPFAAVLLFLCVQSYTDVCTCAYAVTSVV